MFTHIIFIITGNTTPTSSFKDLGDLPNFRGFAGRDINIMIILQLKDELQPDILPQKSKSLNVRSRRSKPLTFENSKLAFAFRKNSTPQRNYKQITSLKGSLYNKAVLSTQTKQPVTSVINSNLNFQIFNIVPPNDDKKNNFLKKKSLKILKTPQKQNTYRNLSKLKRSNTIDNEIKPSRTEILKSMLLQYDKSAEQLARTKKGKQQNKHQKSPFLTDFLQSYPKSKGLNKTAKSNKFKLQQSLKKTIEQQQKSNFSLNEEQIQIIVRNSLREIQLQKKSKEKPQPKSLISFTQRTAYIKKMKRVQNGLQYI